MNPILILGYERSGTTLLRRIVSMHPGLDYELVHENAKKLYSCQTRKQALRKMTYPGTQAGKRTGSTMSIRAGQKIPYMTLKEAKRAYKKFDSLFDTFRVIHITRNPVGCINSQVKTFNRDPSRCVRNYFNSVPQVSKLLADHPKILRVQYEDLVGDPRHEIARIYSWVGGEVSDEHIKAVMSIRDPWKCDGRVMPGLRYFDRIEKQKRRIILPAKLVNKIEKEMR